MLLHTRSITTWVAGNIAVSAAFLHFASWTWLEPNLRGENVARGGDALVWITSAFPILLAATLVNLIWLALVARERRKTNVAWPIPAFILVTVVWLSALTVDHLRSAGF